ncbi:MAG: efflux RND transporter periplasmic adaptor subunit [Candidatus Omnitrophica bacterium]|nr:efflux RND transporter periplasmic adaptor subunit [Candidatus Omnitrophota bacterium]
MKGKNKIITIVFLIVGLIAAGFIINFSYKFFAKDSAKSEKAVYYCPMHTSYTSNKSGDCPICNMRLVKKEVTGQIQENVGVTAGKEKTLEEICVEHKCTIENCPMAVKATLKPGEKIICPVCGEIIGTENGKAVETGKASEAQLPEKTGAGKKERKIIYYRNPMNPQETSQVPMKDSMGMDYIPVYESETGANSISISAEKQQLIGIKTEPVKKMPLTKVIRASGKIAYDPDLYVAQEEYLQALKTVNETKGSVLKSVSEQSKSLSLAARKKLLLLGMSEAEINDLEKKGTAQDSLYLPLGTNSVWAYVSIYEYEIGLVKTGASVDIEAVAYPGEIFKGKVVAINPVLDATTRTNQVRVEVENNSGKLKPEMFVNADIKVDLGKQLAVPDSAVIDTGIRKIVYLSKPGNLLEAREVKLGQHAQGYYEVTEGLSEADTVVTSGNFLVDSESKLKSSL